MTGFRGADRGKVFGIGCLEGAVNMVSLDCSRKTDWGVRTEYGLVGGGKLGGGRGGDDARAGPTVPVPARDSL